MLVDIKLTRNLVKLLCTIREFLKAGLKNTNPTKSYSVV